MTIHIKSRHNARMFAMQALYQWSVTGSFVNDLIAQYMSANDHHKVEWDFFQSILRGSLEHVTEIDAKIAALTDRPFAEVNPVELGILRLATFELMFRLDVPYKVVINEYINFAHEYGAEEGHKFINSILDKLARDLRKIEIAQ